MTPSEQCRRKPLRTSSTRSLAAAVCCFFALLLLLLVDFLFRRHLSLSRSLSLSLALFLSQALASLSLAAFPCALSHTQTGSPATRVSLTLTNGGGARHTLNKEAHKNGLTTSNETANNALHHTFNECRFCFSLPMCAYCCILHSTFRTSPAAAGSKDQSETFANNRHTCTHLHTHTHTQHHHPPHLPRPTYTGTGPDLRRTIQGVCYREFSAEF